MLIKRPSDNSGDIEYQAAKARLEVLQEELLDLELHSATLSEQLFRFQDRYARQIGPLLKKLDELKAELAREQDAFAFSGEEMSDDNDKNETSSEEPHKEDGEVPFEFENAVFSPSEELKSLFKKVAKQIHPDLATDVSEKGIREEFIKRANAAFSKGDMAELAKILREWEDGYLSEFADSISTDLRLVKLSLLQVEEKIREVQAEIEAKLASDMYKLYKEVEGSSTQGGDPLAMMAETIGFQIEHIQELLNGLRERRSQWEQTNR